MSVHMQGARTFLSMCRYASAYRVGILQMIKIIIIIIIKYYSSYRLYYVTYTDKLQNKIILICSLRNCCIQSSTFQFIFK